MPDAPKKYRATLKGHVEEWTQAEHDAVQALTGTHFGEYQVEPLQPAKPYDLPPAKSAELSADGATETDEDHYPTT